MPIDALATLEIPDDGLTLDDSVLGLPIVRVEVRVTGSRWATPAKITSVNFGESLTAETVRRAMRELSATGSSVRLVAEVEPAGSGVVLRVVAVPSRTVAAIQVDGGVLERSGTLRAAGLVSGAEISEAELDAVPGKVAAFYEPHGFPNAVITVQSAQLDATPQDIALIDARKGLEMFQKVAVPILGIVENMSYYCCAQCGHREDIFGHGGARAEADKIGVPFLGEIPLHSMIRSMSDAGTPVTLSVTQSEQAKAFQHIAERVLSGITAAQRPAPTIHMKD